MSDESIDAIAHRVVEEAAALIIQNHPHSFTVHCRVNDGVIIFGMARDSEDGNFEFFFDPFPYARHLVTQFLHAGKNSNESFIGTTVMEMLETMWRSLPLAVLEAGMIAFNRMRPNLPCIGISLEDLPGTIAMSSAEKAAVKKLFNQQLQSLRGSKGKGNTAIISPESELMAFDEVDGCLPFLRRVKVDYRAQRAFWKKSRGRSAEWSRHWVDEMGPKKYPDLPPELLKIICDERKVTRKHRTPVALACAYVAPRFGLTGAALETKYKKRQLKVSG